MEHQQSEVSLKEIIVKLQGVYHYLLRRWLIILAVALIGGILGYVYAFFKKPYYVAQLSFVLEDSKSGALSGYASLASQFGMDLGGGGASGVFSGDNIIEFLKSRLMVQKTLLSPAMMNGDSALLIDLYMQANDLHKRWRSSVRPESFNFSVVKSNFSIQQDSILNVIYENLVRNDLTISKPDKKLSFILVRCKSRSENFAKAFTERLVYEATDFYVKTKTQRSKASIDKLQFKADSLENLLNKKTYSAAVAQDLNLNPARSVARVNTELVNRDKTVLMTMYAEVVKNLEVSRMSMAQEAPIIQIVDAPILPLKLEKFGRLKGLVLGSFLGGFLIIVFLLIKKLYSGIMSSY